MRLISPQFFAATIVEGLVLSLAQHLVASRADPETRRCGDAVPVRLG